VNSSEIRYRPAPPSPTTTNGAQAAEALVALVDQCEHGSAQSLRAADLGSGFQLFECSLDQGDSCIPVNIPMRDEQGTGAGIEECAGQPESASAPFASPAAVLQADKTTQSASSFSLAISDADR